MELNEESAVPPGCPNCDHFIGETSHEKVCNVPSRDRLLPCPFCAGTDISVCFNATLDGPDEQVIGGVWYVTHHCNERNGGLLQICTWIRNEASRDTAIATWNTRAEAYDALLKERDALADHLREVLRTGLNGGDNMRLAFIAAGHKALTRDSLEKAEASEVAVIAARAALALVDKKGK